MRERDSKIFFGGSGLLGRSFLKLYPHYLTPLHREVDIADAKVYEYIQDYKPSVVIHAAAVVGRKEAEEDKEYAYRVNVGGTENIALACRDINARLIYISSVAVFDGEKGEYAEDDIPNPAYYYGWLKLLGEKTVRMLTNHAIIRTDFFSPEGLRYKQAFTDHYCSKMPVGELAVAIERIAESNFQGIIHVGRAKDTLYNILKRFFPDIEGILIENSTMPDFPRDFSLNTTLYNSLFRPNLG